jgi:hypothetical protein
VGDAAIVRLFVRVHSGTIGSRRVVVVLDMEVNITIQPGVLHCTPKRGGEVDYHSGISGWWKLDVS